MKDAAAFHRSVREPISSETNVITNSPIIMPNVTVEFEVTADNGTKAFWIAVDKQDVRLRDGKRSIEVSNNTPHSLVWWFTGDPGGTLSVVGTVAGEKVVEVKNDYIPRGKIYGGGFDYFELSSGGKS